MYPHYFYAPNGYLYGDGFLPNSPYDQQPYYDFRDVYPEYSFPMDRQQSVRGQATWTYGGQTTKCGIPWSRNRFMTASVGLNSPYKCGQSIKIRNLSTPGSREVIVTVVDQVAGYPANRINLHRRAFAALGANPSMGVINIEITPSPELEQEKWGKYLLEVTQTAYPGYNIIEYKSTGKTNISANQVKETYEFILKSPQEKITIRGNVVYNPTTDRIISFDIGEV